MPTVSWRKYNPSTPARTGPARSRRHEAACSASRPAGSEGSRLLDLAIFDLDGTLHRTEAALTPAIRTALAEVGLPPPPDEEIEASYGEPIPVICERLMPGGGEPLHRRFLEALRRAQRETVPSAGECYPGIVETLAEVEGAGWAMAVCSNAGMEYIELVTEALSIRRFFGELSGISGELDKTGRVREMARRAGGLTVVIGDRYIDIEAAAACGLPSIGCRWGYGGEGELEGATCEAGSPAEIPGLLETIRRGSASGGTLYPPQR